MEFLFKGIRLVKVKVSSSRKEKIRNKSFKVSLLSLSGKEERRVVENGKCFVKNEQKICESSYKRISHKHELFL